MGKKYKKNQMENVIGAAFMSVVVIAMCIILVMVSTDAEEVVEKYDLVAINDAQSVNGSFFLGCGSINENMYFVFYFEKADGAIQYKRVKAEWCSVYESDEYKTPKAELINKGNLLSGACYESAKFYVPVGTIKRNYNLDLEN